MSIVFGLCYIVASLPTAPSASSVWEYTAASVSILTHRPEQPASVPMKFTILSHAGLLVEHAGVRVV